jgi:hypothetical protein
LWFPFQSQRAMPGNRRSPYKAAQIILYRLKSCRSIVHPCGPAFRIVLQVQAV